MLLNYNQTFDNKRLSILVIFVDAIYSKRENVAFFRRADLFLKLIRTMPSNFFSKSFSCSMPGILSLFVLFACEFVVDTISEFELLTSCSSTVFDEFNVDDAASLKKATDDDVSTCCSVTHSLMFGRSCSKN